MEDTPPAPPLTAKGSADKVIDWMVPGSEHSVVQPGNAWTCWMAGYPGLVLTHVLVTMAFLQKSETYSQRMDLQRAVREQLPAPTLLLCGAEARAAPGAFGLHMTKQKDGEA